MLIHVGDSLGDLVVHGGDPEVEPSEQGDLLLLQNRGGLAENVQGEVLGVKAQGGSRIIDLVPLGNVL